MVPLSAHIHYTRFSYRSESRLFHSNIPVMKIPIRHCMKTTKCKRMRCRLYLFNPLPVRSLPNLNSWSLKARMTTGSVNNLIQTAKKKEKRIKQKKWKKFKITRSIWQQQVQGCAFSLLDLKYHNGSFFPISSSPGGTGFFHLSATTILQTFQENKQSAPDIIIPSLVS